MLLGPIPCENWLRLYNTDTLWAGALDLALQISGPQPPSNCFALPSVYLLIPIVLASVSTAVELTMEAASGNKSFSCK